MAKGDADKVQNQIDYQGNTAKNNVNNALTYNTGQTGNFQQLYAPAAQQNVADYGSGQSAYDQFLKSSGNLYNQFLGPKYAGATQTGPASNQPLQIDPNAHPVDQLLTKYGAKDTGPGSGVTDASYW